MSVINLDLTKNPEVAALIADMEPGDKVYACFTIKSKDDQTGAFRLQEMTSSKDDLPEADEGYEDDDGDDVEESPEGREEDGPSKPEPKEDRRKAFARKMASPDPEVNY